jgi:hypothetical protein
VAINPISLSVTEYIALVVNITIMLQWNFPMQASPSLILHMTYCVVHIEIFVPLESTVDTHCCTIKKQLG